MRLLPNLSQLRTFEAAARLESFALAAHELSVTPSAVSHQIKELEQHFGRPLFLRANRQVKVSHEGRRLQATLSRVFDALAAACAEVSLPEDEQVLAVHCAPSFAVKWLGPRLQAFLDQAPAVTLRLTTGAEALDLRAAREVDLDIGYGYVRSSPGVLVTPLGQEHIAPLVSPRLLMPGLTPAETLAQLTLIDSSLSPVTWQDWFALQRLPFPGASRPSFDRAALAIAAATDGMGVALESTTLADKELARGNLVILGEGTFKPIRQATHFLCQRSDERQRPAIQAFVLWLQAELHVPAAPR
jgi:LysR family transcriptional regulator, glycine cleavage system transcriptional activator